MKQKVNEELLIKFLLNEAGPEEKELVERWIGESSENEKRYADFKLILESSEVFAPKNEVNEEEAWTRFQQRVQSSETSVSKRRLSGLQWLKVAAILILVSVGLWLSYISIINPKGHNTIIIVQTFNETKIDTLPDGSIITLNKNSQLSYPRKFSGNNRTISLDGGEAFFSITPDPSKPFIVNINDIQVKVVGTSFNIKTGNDHTELIVETGIVEVSKKDIIIRLKRNEMVDIGKDNSFEKKINTDQLYKYYRNKEFIADDTPLWRLVDVLNDAYDAQIIIEGNGLKNILLNTTFKDKSLDTILDIICQTLNIEAEKRGDQIILHR